MFEAAPLTHFPANAEILHVELQTTRARAEAAERQRMDMGGCPLQGITQAQFHMLQVLQDLTPTMLWG